MINNLNLSLKFNNKSNELDTSRPFTPIEATLKTPIDPPPHNIQHQHVSSQPMQISSSSASSSNSFYFNNNPWAEQQQQSVYQHPQYNESDDILTDIDEPGFNRRNYTVYFTNTFDQLLMSIYSNILSLPTTTPFSGSIPPSGLTGKVANEIMLNLIKSTSNSANTSVYDQQGIINRDYLKNHEYQPIILQLIRKRLLDLCHYNNTGCKLPEATTTQVNSSLRHSSISNLSLNELNLVNYPSNNSTTGTSSMPGGAAPVPPQRSGSSSLNLRKQSLTRNNSNNWLHVGNMNNLRPPASGYSNFNISTDSLQSIQDSVPQSIITRTGNVPVSTPSSGPIYQQPNPQYAMMMEYTQNNNSHTPPSNNKGSLYTPPPSANSSSINFNLQQHDEFEFFQRTRSRSGSRTLQLPTSHALNIDTNLANLQLHHQQQSQQQPNYNSYPRNNSTSSNTLDSPFMSATTPNEEYYSGFPQPGLNTSGNGNSPLSGDSPDSMKDSGRFTLPSSVTLNEKKRDSLKLKRGIH
ncbi:hypothetical protein JA1_004797 [Spathaspora sp. JA1]|nr:hypothetical protein JA1_004797 [Spathaspora sp. JA1]